MKTDEFNGKTGKLVQAPSALYSTFEPNPIPIPIQYEQIWRTLGDAREKIGELAGIAQHLRSPSLFVLPYMRREAYESTKIEGTRTTLSEVFLQENDENEDSEDPDIQEVINYRQALEAGVAAIQTQAITEELLKELHKILMRGVRGDGKQPGLYKTSPNFHGPTRDILQADFVYAHPQTVERLMKNLIEYINSADGDDQLIRAGIAHYQFEAIHPFADGNGRIGRLLIILHLCKTGKLPQPLLYLSAYFEKNDDKYKRHLYEVSSQGNIENWLNFFFTGVILQAGDAIEKARKLEAYREQVHKIISTNNSSTIALQVVDLFFENPYADIRSIRKRLNISDMSARYSVDILLKNEIITLTDQNKKRNRIYVAAEVARILGIHNR